MILGILALLISFCISAVAIYFSVTGWVALFSAAAIGVALMFGAIEIGKLVAAGFLHWHWHNMPKLHRYILTTMVGITMLITSVGVYGYLSKGHLDQELPASNAEIQIERVDQQIDQYDKQIERANRIIDQNKQREDELNSIINTLVEYDRINDNSNGQGALTTREQQKQERQVIQQNIDNAQKDINEAFKEIDILQEKKLELNHTLGNVKAKLGPILYIVDLLNFNDKDLAVQLVILLSIFVFDPFAIALLLAGLWSIKHHKPKRNKLLEAQEPVIKQTPKISEMDSIIEETKEALKSQPELVDELEEAIQKDYPEMAKQLEDTFIRAKNEVRIRKEGWLDR